MAIDKRRKKAKLEVPKGGKKKDVRVREAIILNELAPLQGRYIRSKNTGKSVKIIGKGIKETAHHAAKSRYSTLTALDAKRQIKNSKKVDEFKPNKNKSQSRLKPKKMVELKGKNKQKTSKIMVAEKRYKKTTKSGKTKKKTVQLLYCVTGK